MSPVSPANVELLNFSTDQQLTKSTVERRQLTSLAQLGRECRLTVHMHPIPARVLIVETTLRSQGVKFQLARGLEFDRKKSNNHRQAHNLSKSDNIINLNHQLQPGEVCRLCPLPKHLTWNHVSGGTH